jgi:hypothetical protein
LSTPNPGKALDASLGIALVTAMLGSRSEPPILWKSAGQLKKKSKLIAVAYYSPLSQSVGFQQRFGFSYFIALCVIYTKALKLFDVRRESHGANGFDAPARLRWDRFTLLIGIHFAFPPKGKTPRQRGLQCG